MVRKTGVQVRILKRRGLLFYLHRYRARKMFVAVMLVAVACVAILSQRIWRIEVVGNSSISEETILDYLEEKDIVYGVSKSRIDNDSLELSLRQDFDPVIWASVYEEGTKLVICVQEKIASVSVESDDDTCMDLVADKDAVIASIITRKGLATVKAGDSVKEGDIIVCGRQEILDDNGEVKEYFYQSADADIMAYASYDYEDDISATMINSENTGRKRTRYVLRIFQYQLLSPKIYADYDYYETIEEVEQLCLMDSFYLPVYFGTIQELEQKKTVTDLSMEDAKTIALEHFNQFITDLEENGVLICDKNVMIEKIGKKYHIYGQVDVCEKIVRQEPTEVLENPPEEGSSE
jgi:similar to stage IV sporulation protein